MVLEEITISLKLIWAGVNEGLKSAGDSIDQFRNKVTNLGSPFGQVTNAQQEFVSKMRQAGVPAKQLNQKMNDLNLSLKEDGVIFDHNSGLILGQDAAMKKITQSGRRFKMELLGLMFFGMAINRFFASLTKGALEASGAMNIWSTTTMLFGLPAALKITDSLLGLLDMYLSLPAPMQTALSWLLFFGQGLGTVLQTVGAMGLGLWSLGLAAKTLGMTLGEFLIGLAGIFLILVGLAVVVYAIVRFFQNWNDGGNKLLKVLELIMIAGAGLLILLAGLAIVAPAAWLAVLGPIGLVLGAVMAVAAAIYLIIKYWDQIKGFFVSIGNFAVGKGWTTTPTKMQAGGIVTSPTRALIGEAGPEAIIPLNSAGGMMPANITYNISDVKLSGDIDINTLAKRLNDMLITDMRRRAT